MFPFISVQRFLSSMRRRPNDVVLGASLNVGQRHRRRANITPLWFKASYREHEVLTRAEWIHLKDIGSVSACTCRQQYALPAPQPSKHEALNQCWFEDGPASQTVGQNWTSIGSTSCVCRVLTGYVVFRTSWGVKILKLLLN